ncbi:uncharacterized protein MONBRDRAFT_34458 [Monosiga brevicollis MX1]|uniref:non-specific protein-tyrosine kinase n=1 Tax=Monosiga brevicollis TaxID=81824 RepID=A9VBW0_MONBE|nr:uncharacterized protein MONBRDRAFT_34458 [Monosiga brevicollis MX1]EDQ85045.1 predicted protein [Monosiga brevicollis MX1]|eukprot:XP_001750215.1 hypothetical protein [Monosiga brevicollis MX1]
MILSLSLKPTKPIQTLSQSLLSLKLSQTLSNSLKLCSLSNSLKLSQTSLSLSQTAQGHSLTWAASDGASGLTGLCEPGAGIKLCHADLAVYELPGCNVANSLTLLPDHVCTSAIVPFDHHHALFHACTDASECADGMYCATECFQGVCGNGNPALAANTSFCQLCSNLDADQIVPACQNKALPHALATASEQVAEQPLNLVFQGSASDARLTSDHFINEQTNSTMGNATHDDLLYFPAPPSAESYVIQVDTRLEAMSLTLGPGVRLQLHQSVSLSLSEKTHLCVADRTVTEEPSSCAGRCPANCLSCELSGEDDFRWVAYGRRFYNPVYTLNSRGQNTRTECENLCRFTALGKCFGYDYDPSEDVCNYYVGYLPSLDDASVIEAGDTFGMYLRPSCRLCAPGTVFDPYSGSCEYDSIPPTFLATTDQVVEAIVTEGFVQQATDNMTLFTSYIQVRASGLGLPQLTLQHSEDETTAPLVTTLTPTAVEGRFLFQASLPSLGTALRARAIDKYYAGRTVEIVLSVNLIRFVRLIRRVHSYAYPLFNVLPQAPHQVSVLGLPPSMNATARLSASSDPIFAMVTGGIVELDARQEPYIFEFVYTHPRLRGSLSCERAITVRQGFALASTVIDRLASAHAQYDILVAPDELSSATPDLPSFTGDLFENDALNFGIVNAHGGQNVPFTLDLSKFATSANLTWSMTWCASTFMGEPTYTIPGNVTVTLSMIDGVSTLGVASMWLSTGGECLYSTGTLPFTLGLEAADLAAGLNVSSYALSAINFRFEPASLPGAVQGFSFATRGQDRLMLVFNDPSQASRLSNVDNVAPKLFNCPQSSELLSAIRAAFGLASTDAARLPLGVDQPIADASQPLPNSSFSVYGSPYFFGYSAQDSAGNIALQPCSFELPIQQYESTATTVTFPTRTLQPAMFVQTVTPSFEHLKIKTFTLLDTTAAGVSVGSTTNKMSWRVQIANGEHGVHVRRRSDALSMQFYLQLAVDEYSATSLELAPEQDEAPDYRRRSASVPAVVEIAFAGVTRPDGAESDFLADRWYKLESASIAYQNGREVISGYSPKMDHDFVFEAMIIRVQFPQTRTAIMPTASAALQFKLRYTLHTSDPNNAALAELTEYDPDPPTMESQLLNNGLTTIATLPNASYAVLNIAQDGILARFFVNGVLFAFQDDSPIVDVAFSPGNGAALNLSASPFTVTVTAMDDDLNLATETFQLAVYDPQTPMFLEPCPRTVVLQVPPNASDGQVEVHNPDELAPPLSSTWDNAGVVTRTVQGLQNRYRLSDTGAMVTTTIEDAAGNSAMCNITVDVRDITPPVVVCPDSSVDLLVEADSAEVDLHREVSVTDNSGTTVVPVFNFSSSTFVANNGAIVFIIIIAAVILVVVMRARANRAADFAVLKARLEQDSNLQLSKEPRELNREWLIVLSELGQGAFGIVYEASLSEPKAPEIQVAAKSLRKDAMDNEREELLEEALVMAQMEHANVVGLIGVITKGRPIYVVLEHMRNGSLKDYVMNKTCTPAQQVTWSRQVASGMAHIHSLGFIHRDLAARNVLLSASLTAKVADFGLARESTDDAYYRSRGGNVPVRWTAPEALEDNIFSEKSDVWAFGVLMYEVYTKAAMPYTGWNNQRVWIEVTNGFRLPCPADCPLPVFKIMSMCWLHDRHERPSFETLVKALAALETDSDMSSLFQSNYIEVDDASEPETDEVYGNEGNVSAPVLTRRLATASDVGSRVDVVGYGMGTLRYFGPHKVKRSPRCGVELDDAVGNNNGTVGEHEYFDCADQHGVLVIPGKVFVVVEASAARAGADLYDMGAADTGKAQEADSEAQQLYDMGNVGETNTSTASTNELLYDMGNAGNAATSPASDNELLYDMGRAEAQSSDAFGLYDMGAEATGTDSMERGFGFEEESQME